MKTGHPQHGVQQNHPPLILASGSTARKFMLREAGLSFQAIPANIDEESITLLLQQKGAAPHEIAATLAQHKAQHICAQIAAAKSPGESPLVIGSDQVLWCEGRLYSKAQDEDEAQQTLRELRGKTHELVSAVCIIREGRILWAHHDTVRLTMNGFNDDFLRGYMAAAGRETLLGCVGCYALETTAGKSLFAKIEGKFHTVLGMPLTPLLAFLRTQGYAPRDVSGGAA